MIAVEKHYLKKMMKKSKHVVRIFEQYLIDYLPEKPFGCIQHTATKHSTPLFY